VKPCRTGRRTSKLATKRNRVAQAAALCQGLDVCPRRRGPVAAGEGRRRWCRRSVGLLAGSGTRVGIFRVGPVACRSVARVRAASGPVTDRVGIRADRGRELSGSAPGGGLNRGVGESLANPGQYRVDGFHWEARGRRGVSRRRRHRLEPGGQSPQLGGRRGPGVAGAAWGRGALVGRPGVVVDGWRGIRDPVGAGPQLARGRGSCVTTADPALMNATATAAIRTSRGSIPSDRAIAAQTPPRTRSRRRRSRRAHAGRGEVAGVWSVMPITISLAWQLGRAGSPASEKPRPGAPVPDLPRAPCRVRGRFRLSYDRSGRRRLCRQ